MIQSPNNKSQEAPILDMTCGGSINNRLPSSPEREAPDMSQEEALATLARILRGLEKIGASNG